MLYIIGPAQLSLNHRETTDPLGQVALSRTRGFSPSPILQSNERERKEQIHQENADALPFSLGLQKPSLWVSFKDALDQPRDTFKRVLRSSLRRTPVSPLYWPNLYLRGCSWAGPLLSRFPAGHRNKLQTSIRMQKKLQNQPKTSSQN